MTDSTGLPPTRYSAIVTREVRWFAAGPLPDDVRRWFTIDGTAGDLEERVDRYSIDHARLGAGVKVRGDVSLDNKRLLSTHDADLGHGLSGRIEDWVKTMKPIPEGWHRQDGRFVSITKTLITRRYLLDPDRTDAAAPGCEAELAELVIADMPAWSFCLETFGDPSQRAEALTAGLDALLAESPLPSPDLIGAGFSCGYPCWLADTFNAPQQTQVPAL